MKTLQEIKDKVEGIIESFNQLMKVPSSFRQARTLDNKIKESLEELRKNLDGFEAPRDETLEQDVAKLDSMLSGLQSKLLDMQGLLTEFQLAIGELYEKVRKK